ncbi:MAG: hypothetical protein QM820_62460 [Minicystis sp.]
MPDPLKFILAMALLIVLGPRVAAFLAALTVVVTLLLATGEYAAHRE